MRQSWARVVNNNNTYMDLKALEIEPNNTNGLLNIGGIYKELDVSMRHYPFKNPGTHA